MSQEPHMSDVKTWNPLTDWKPVDVDWIKVDISKEDLQRFATRSDSKGLLQAGGFLLIVCATGGFAWWAFQAQRWILLALALYLHGIVYGHFGEGIHELTHGTVFKSKWLTKTFIGIYGWLYWPWNPHLYRLSHQGYHHRYTLHQGSDGEDTPNYAEFKPRNIVTLFFNVLHVRSLLHNLGRLFTLKPTSIGWRGRGYRLDTWEQFVLSRASDKDRRKVYRFAIFNLVSHVLFVAGCIATGNGFLPVLITFAPFYGPYFHGAMCSTHQHTACEPNHPDFRVSCGDAILDPISSFLYWHMEYHIEHHMFASIPCYNLKPFRDFVADQMPARTYAIPRLKWLHDVCQKKYGSWQYWRDHFGLYKGY